MYERIRQNLHRQGKALEVLEELLKEEFALLCERQPRAMSSTQFSIHELLRQIAVEREGLVKLLSGKRLNAYAADLEPEQAETLRSLVRAASSVEQRCALQSERNAELAFALLDQSRSLLTFLHERIAPKREDTYSARGRFTAVRPEAALIRGRL